LAPAHYVSLEDFDVDDGTTFQEKVNLKTKGSKLTCNQSKKDDQ